MNKKLKRVNSIHRKKQRILKSRIKEQKAKAQTERKAKAAEQNVKAAAEQKQEMKSEQNSVTPVKDTASNIQE